MCVCTPTLAQKLLIHHTHPHTYLLPISYCAVRTKQSSKLNASKLQSMLNRSVGSKFSHRSNSFDSVSTESSSSTRNTASTRSSNGTTVNDDDDDDYSKECVSSIVILGDGCFLTGMSVLPSRDGVYFY